MSITIDAIFDGKALQPQQPLALEQHQHYSVTIDKPAIDSVIAVPLGDRASCVEPSAATEESVLAWQIYDSKLKPLLEPMHNGKIVAVDLTTEDFEVASRGISAWKALKSRRPSGRIVLIDIGLVNESDPLERRRGQ